MVEICSANHKNIIKCSLEAVLPILPGIILQSMTTTRAHTISLFNPMYYHSITLFNPFFNPYVAFVFFSLLSKSHYFLFFRLHSNMRLVFFAEQVVFFRQFLLLEFIIFILWVGIIISWPMGPRNRAPPFRITN